MPRETGIEFKVGIIMIAAFVALAVFVLLVGNFDQFREGKRFYVTFHFVGGLKRSSPVRLAGVDSGVVEHVALLMDRKNKTALVRVTIKVDPSVEVPVGSTVLINQLGLFGEKYLEILPDAQQTGFYQENDVIKGKDPVIQEHISERIVDLTKKVEDAVQDVHRLIGDEESQQAVKASLQHLSSLSENLDVVTREVRSGQGTLGRLLYDDRMYDDLESFAADLKANPWKLLYRPR